LRRCALIVELAPLIAEANCAKPRRISGRCAMISCELGRNPMRSLDLASRSLSSGTVSGGNGASRGMFLSLGWQWTYAASLLCFRLDRWERPARQIAVIQGE
jgi:hypothetical protein